MTAKQYAENLDENLYNLHQRLCRGQYVASPVKRIRVDKEDGKKRPIDIPALEDKIVQIDHNLLRDIIRLRVNDGGIIRLIGKWLNAGVAEGGEVIYPDKGTPQGGVISPVLSNIFLHYVLDDWYVKHVQPRMKGKCFPIRFADDFIMGFQMESDAKRMMEVLPNQTLISSIIHKYLNGSLAPRS